MRPRSNVVQDNVVRAASKRLCRRPPPCARLRFLCGSGAAAAIRELLTQPRSERTRKTLAPTPGTWKSQGSENRLRSLRSCNFGVQGAWRRASFIAIRRRQFKQPDVCIWHPAPSATRSVSRGSWACRWAHAPRTRYAPRTRTYSHQLPRPRSCAPHHVAVSGGATGGKVCRTSQCQCRRRLEECHGSPHRLHVLWLARSCSIRALLTQPRCRSGTAPHCFGRQGVSSVCLSFSVCPVVRVY